MVKYYKLVYALKMKAVQLFVIVISCSLTKAFPILIYKYVIISKVFQLELKWLYISIFLFCVYTFVISTPKTKTNLETLVSML